MSELATSLSASAPDPESTRRWAAVGHSVDTDAFAAGSAAASAALVGADPKLLVVFCSDSYELPALLSAIAGEAPGTPLIGCTTAGEIAAGRASTASVVVTAFGGPGFAVQTAAAPHASERLREAGEEVAAALSEPLESHPHQVAILLSDALAGDQREVIRGAYAVLGAAVPLVGGCAGDDFKLSATFQFYGGEVVSDTLVGAVLASEAPLGVGVRHGWRPVGEPILVTRSAQNRVYTLDDRPALDVYLERFDAPEEARTDAAAFAQFSMTHPLGLGQRSTEEGARYVASANFEDGSLNMIAEVPQGGIVRFLEGDVDSVLGATDGACREALEALGGRDPLLLLAFDCAARRLVLGDEGIERETELIAGHACGAPIAGFYSYGEIARTRGAGGFHNETLVVLAVS
ncbi:MAG TPA: FIST N-terminal domain-containing protein [Solirubrobacteraceae bacterium]|jgi:hypothetical protein|nr:FIST N-terminal domain-containing protein [Solirubrobacteraceae bacterium]